VDIWTVGHSNRSLDEFVALIAAHDVELLVDVRTVPRSRHNPQFNVDVLPGALSAVGIDHRHVPELGGLRRPRKDSPNAGWRGDSFRGFADYMQTEEFERALDELVAVAGRTHTAFMCAEAVPWRCHRSLIADALTARGVDVFHIMSATAANPHRLNPMAVVRDGRVTYPGPEQLALE
jgi:uncharacterized protein (DUF488 family)